MPVPRTVGLVDLAIATVVLVMVILPPREMYAGTALRGPSAQRQAEQFALALAEARTLARPSDGKAVDELTRRLGQAGFKDWAVETAIRGSERAASAPSRWRALLAASVAFVDRLDVVPALDYANRALAACDAEQAGSACPSWEQIRMKLYQQHLYAGVKSGIDPRKGPEAAAAFRRAGESALRQIHLRGRDVPEDRATPPPTRTNK